jgi:hypothetical protein
MFIKSVILMANHLKWGKWKEGRKEGSRELLVVMT